MKVLTGSQIRAAEENAVSSGIFSFAELMQNAGTKAADIISEKYDIMNKKVTVVCGKGNNGGDGFVIADILSGRGAEVTLCLPFGEPATDTAGFYYNKLPRLKKSLRIDDDCDILIDAVFGIGLDRPLIDKAASLIDDMNLCCAEKIAIDIPSGVFCDGTAVSKAFKADLTITFIALKPCFLLPASSEFCGKVIIADIGIPITEYSYLTIEPPTAIYRPKNSHKGTFGTAALICGSYGMCGAEILSATAALRSGVGIVKALVCDKNYSAFCGNVPEAVTVPCETLPNGSPLVDNITLSTLLSNSDALLLGCGLGRNEEIKKLVTHVLLNVEIPVVIDADGINAVSSDISIIRKIKAPVILTPHPAEMARLCHTDVSKIESNRPEFASKFASEHSCVVVLKGANTVVASPDGRIFFNTTGNPGMATGGSGDVLAGMIVSRLAQGEGALRAALSSVWLHGRAADLAIEKQSFASLLPRDIIEELKELPV